MDKFKKDKNKAMVHDVIELCSCETIGEGVDINDATMCVFVDPKSSYVKIVQNIGRIVRKQWGVEKPRSTILVPCRLDKLKYQGCGDDRDKCDEVIRNDMSKDGNFNGILNVISALRQEDEDIYDMCLHYSNEFSPKEIQNNLEKQGYCLEEGRSLRECLGMDDVNDELYDDECETDEEKIQQIAEDQEMCIEIHSNSLENPIVRYNNNVIRRQENKGRT